MLISESIIVISVLNACPRQRAASRAGAHHDSLRPWVSYGGDARTWLAIALLAVAGSATFAGIRLPLPVRVTRPVRAGRVAMIVAWVASIAALLACVTIYLRQSIHAYDLSAPAAAPGIPSPRSP